MDRFRKYYTPITGEQKSLVVAIKEKAEELEALIIQSRRDIRQATAATRRDESDSHVELAYEANDCSIQALARLEESVMWAVKAVTTEIAAVPA